MGEHVYCAKITISKGGQVKGTEKIKIFPIERADYKFLKEQANDSGLTIEDLDHDKDTVIMRVLGTENQIRNFILAVGWKGFGSKVKDANEGESRGNVLRL